MAPYFKCDEPLSILWVLAWRSRHAHGTVHHRIFTLGMNKHSTDRSVHSTCSITTESCTDPGQGWYKQCGNTRCQYLHDYIHYSGSYYRDSIYIYTYIINIYDMNVMQIIVDWWIWQWLLYLSFWFRLCWSHLVLPARRSSFARLVEVMPSPLRWFHCFRHGRIYSSHHAYIHYLVCVHAIRFL